MKGDLDGSITDLTKALELDPRSAEAFTYRGAAKLAKTDAEGAIADFSKALELNPRAARALGTGERRGRA